MSTGQVGQAVGFPDAGRVLNTTRASQRAKVSKEEVAALNAGLPEDICLAKAWTTLLTVDCFLQLKELSFAEFRQLVGLHP